MGIKFKLLTVLTALLMVCCLFMFVSCSNDAANSDTDSRIENDIDLDDEKKEEDPSTNNFKLCMLKVLTKGFSADLSASFGEITVEGTATLDCAFGSLEPQNLLLSLPLKINGTEIKIDVQFTENQTQKYLFLEIADKKLAFNINDLNSALSVIGQYMEDGSSLESIKSLNIPSILNLVGSIDVYSLMSFFDSIVGTEKDGAYKYSFAVGGATILLDSNAQAEFSSLTLGDFNLNGTPLTLSLTNISLEHEKPEVKNILDYFDIKTLLDNRAISLDINATLFGQTFDGQIAVDFNDEIIVKADLNIGSKALTAYYTDNTVYVEINGMRLKCAVEDIEYFINLFGQEVNFEMPINTADTLDNVKFEDGKILITAFGAEITINSDLTASISMDDISASIGNIKAADGITLPTEEYYDISTLIANKAISLDINATLFGQTVDGQIAVDFNDEIIVKADINISGNALTAYYTDNTVYVEINGIRLKCAVDDIEYFINLFGQEVNFEMPVNTADTLDNVKFEDGKIIITAFGGEITINSDLTASISMDDISASIGNIKSANGITLPNKEFYDISNVKTLSGKIAEAFDEREFTFNGSFTVDGTTVNFVDARVINSGSGDYQKDFDDGLLNIAGGLSFVYGGSTHNINATFVDNELYLQYNENLKVKLNRSSMDNIVSLISTYKDDLVSGLSVAGLGVMDTVKNLDLSLEKVFSILKNIEIVDQKITLLLDLSSVNLGEMTVSCFIKDNLLHLETEGMITSEISVDYTATDIVAPTDAGSYMDVSNIEKLIEGLLITSTKNDKTYSLSGTIELSFIGINAISVDIEAYVRVTEDDKIEAYISWDTGKPSLIIGAAANSYITFGKSLVLYTDGNIYIDRTDYLYKVVYWKTETNSKKLTAEEFSNNATEAIFYITGLSSSLNESSGGDSGEDKTIHFENVFKGYNNIGESHLIVVDMNELTKEDMFSDAEITLMLNNDKYLTDLDISMSLEASIITINITVDAKLNPLDTGVNSLIDGKISALNASAYSNLFS